MNDERKKALDAALKRVYADAAMLRQGLERLGKYASNHETKALALLDEAVNKGEHNRG